METDEKIDRGALPGPSIGVGIIIIAALAVVGISSLILRYGVNVPIGDQWEMVPIFEDYRDGRLNFSDLWQQHNEHRILFPRLIMLVIAPMTQWNSRAEMLTGVVFVLVSFLLLVHLIYSVRRGNGRRDWLLIPGAAAVGAALFSPVQWENWLWGWELQWFLNVLALVATIWSLWILGPSKPGGAVAIAAFAALVGTYSLAPGSLIWVVSIPIFLVNPQLRRYLIPWVAAGALVTVSYFYQYQKPIHHPPFAAFFEDARTSATFVLTYIGRPIPATSKYAWLAAVAEIAVMLGCLFFAARLRRRLVTNLIPFTAIAGYVVATALITGVGRAGFGLHHAATSRYTTISVLMVVATIGSLYAVVPASRERRAGVGFGVVCIALIVVLLHDLPDELNSMQEWRDHTLAARKCLVQATYPTEGCLTLAYPDGPTVFKRSRQVIEWGWGGLE